MAAQQIVPGLTRIPLGAVNAYLIEAPDGCVLIDSGYPGSAPDVMAAVRAAGRQPADVHHLIASHGHPDHIGSLAELKRATGAAVYCHPADAQIVRTGTGVRPMATAPGLLNQLIVRLVIAPKARKLGQVDPTPVDHELSDGQTLPIAGGLTVLHAPGHCAGQVALLWHAHGGVLIAADAASHVMGLNVSPVNEDLALARRSLARLGTQTFTTACFGHGKPITDDAAAQFRAKWPAG